jgi:hypothetical protein
MRPFLSQSIKNAVSWSEFCKEAEEMIWLCFSETINDLNRIPSESCINNVKNIRTKERNGDDLKWATKKKNLCFTWKW